MAVCLVTGGAGFIGSHLVDALVEAGHQVRVLDDFSTGSRANLAQVRDQVTIIQGDVTHLDTVREATRGVELVFHQAALASVPQSLADPRATHDICATGTLNVLLGAREAQVRRLIYAASSSVYGDTPTLPKRETDTPLPLSPYAVAKLAGEHYCATFSHVYGLETVRLRYFNVFGPRQVPGGPYSAVVPLFLEAMRAGRRPTIFGDGRQSRDFTYVGDIVQANLLAANVSRISGKVYNVAAGRRTTLLDLIEVLNQLLGTRIAPVHAPARAGDVRDSQACIARAQTELGFCPATELRNGLRRCVNECSAPRAGPAAEDYLPAWQPSGRAARLSPAATS